LIGYGHQKHKTALHLWTQIVGKYRLTHAPWMYQTLYLTPRGLALDAREIFLLAAINVADLLDRVAALVGGLAGKWTFTAPQRDP
jgi:hypothetical protein